MRCVGQIPKHEHLWKIQCFLGHFASTLTTLYNFWCLLTSWNSPLELDSFLSQPVPAVFSRLSKTIFGTKYFEGSTNFSQPFLKAIGNSYIHPRPNEKGELAPGCLFILLCHCGCLSLNLQSPIQVSLKHQGAYVCPPEIFLIILYSLTDPSKDIMKSGPYQVWSWWQKC